MPLSFSNIVTSRGRRLYRHIETAREHSKPAGPVPILIPRPLALIRFAAQPLAVALLSTQRVLPALVETTVYCFDVAFVLCRSFQPDRSPCDEQRAMWGFPYTRCGNYPTRLLGNSRCR
jgi:hypothetical protein